ncbi:TPA: retron St85 family RNA-directed DNA polymerase [Bacillus thuringiensis]|nr:retron St85 family RNA-directed DNA polymerase [Bacillus thuringiensis]
MNAYVNNLVNELLKTNHESKYIDLCAQYSNRLIDNNLPVIFDKTHLALLIGLEKSYLTKLYLFENYTYKKVKIPKSSSGYRELDIPIEGLKFIQRWILENILENIPVSDYATGFVKSTSIVNNASKHINKECVINLDIKDFFPSIEFESIFKIFYYHGYTKEVSYILAKLTTFDSRLPQGAPTSPYISNLICLKLDKRLSHLANKLNANYTRYADDITFSGKIEITKHIELIKEIIQNEGFNVNDKKTRVQYYFQRQEVTGLIVNKKISVSKELKRNLRKDIYLCQKYGVYSHMKKIGIEKSNYKEHLYGLAYFIKMVEKEIGEKFLEELDTIHWDY